VDAATLDPLLRAGGRPVFGAFRGTVFGLVLLGALWWVLDRRAGDGRR